ncbi:MAG: hypothetical protein Q9227_004391 [Pyrenula ochraceoflavens]
MDGGNIWWNLGYSDGHSAPAQDPSQVDNNGNAAGIIYSLNLGMSFDSMTTNFTSIFNSTSKANGAANNIAPNYVDGTMFTNDDELYLYGGLSRLTDSESDQDAQSVLGYEAYQYGPYRQSWTPGFYAGELSSGVNRYITNGAGVSIPSENLGFYFSGMRAPNHGPIHGGDQSATVAANSLISVDMSTMRKEKWTNTTLPSSVKPRANAELAWVPISSSGILVAIGGVVNPEEIFVGTGLNKTQLQQSQSTSPGFMTQIPVFDIVGGTWYIQNTTGDDHPPQLTEFCSVVAVANDSSSFNIYIYGGYDGLNSEDTPSDDVWVLSLPSFTWIKVYSGRGAHGRSSHKCKSVYPDQMFVIGGVHEDVAQCLSSGLIEVFNLNKLAFQDSYDPTIYSQYQVPPAISKVIGGDVNGGATKSFPQSSGNEALANLFNQRYTKTIKPWYPYNPTSPSPSSTNTPPGVSVSHDGGLASWVAPVLGVVLGLIAISILVVLFLLWRRRRLIKRRSSYATSVTGSNTNRIMRWVNGMPAHVGHKDDPSVTDTELDDSIIASPGGYLSPRDQQPAEVGGNQRYELSDAPVPVEMPTPYNDDQYGYSRSTDFAIGANGGSRPSAPSGGLRSDVSMASGEPSQPSASSPTFSPHSPEHVGNHNYSSFPARGPGSPSPLTASRAVSPEGEETHSNADGTANNTSLSRRPTHQRNMSSKSSGLGALPSPGGTTSPEEERRQSDIIERLPASPEEEEREQYGLIDDAASSSERQRKQSSFIENVD